MDLPHLPRPYLYALEECAADDLLLYIYSDGWNTEERLSAGLTLKDDGYLNIGAGQRNQVFEQTLILPPDIYWQWLEFACGEAPVLLQKYSFQTQLPGVYDKSAFEDHGPTVYIRILQPWYEFSWRVPADVELIPEIRPAYQALLQFHTLFLSWAKQGLAQGELKF